MLYTGATEIMLYENNRNINGLKLNYALKRKMTWKSTPQQIQKKP